MMAVVVDRGAMPSKNTREKDVRAFAQDETRDQLSHEMGFTHGKLVARPSVLDAIMIH